MSKTSRWLSVIGMAIACLHAGCGGGGTPDGDQGVEPCTNHADCDDALFCTGTERCMPSHPDALANGCVLAEPPCSATSCDEAEERCQTECADVDNDGHTDAACGGDDCDDDDNLRFPGNTEVCDAGSHDEDCDPCTVGNTDADEDLFLDAACRNTVAVGTTPACGISVTYDASSTSIRGLDCNDDAEMIKPGQAETCNQVDDDCDEDTDEDLTLQPFWPDVDMDQAGDEGATPVFACARPEGTSATDDDCDDSKSEVRPLATELCDELDNDCDGETDEQSATYTYYRDEDGDGVGSSTQPQTTATCEPPTGYSALANDCADTNALIYPGATELCDRLDNNCSQVVNPGGVAADEDADADGHAPVGATCDSSAMDTLPADDCDETSALVHGGASEYCSGRDEDCDGDTDETGPDVCSPGDTCSMGCVSGSRIAVGWTEACAVLDDGGVACWGRPGMESITRMPGITTAEQVATGNQHACVRLADRTVRCWGDNTYGQLGAGHQSSVTGLVTPLGLGEVLAVDVGNEHTCALKLGGEVWCWGWNPDGRIGLGSTPSAAMPTRVPGLTDVVELALRSSGGCTRTSNGMVDCWGTGPAGDGVNSFVTTPLRVMTDVLELSADESVSGTCARRATGWSCWGNGPAAGTGVNMTVQAPTPLSVPSGTDQVAYGSGFGCALANGDVSCWGESDFANFGISPAPVGIVAATDAVTVPLTRMPTELDCGGFSFCCGLAGPDVTCWGLPESSRHGDGLRDGRVPNVPVGLSDVTAIDMGGAICALDEGALRCWGAAESTGFGDGVTRYLPDTLIPSGIAQVSMGLDRTCTRSTTGTVQCWGLGLAGDQALTMDATVPVTVDQSMMGPATQVTTGGSGSDQFTCALDNVGTAWCWGTTTLGLCGNGSSTCPRPVQVSGGLTFSSIAAGPLHVCGVTDDGDLYCWGSGQYGKLGNGSTTGNVNAPVQVLGVGGVGFLTGIAEVAPMYSSTCALHDNGQVVCFGENSNSQLGSAGPTTSTPIGVPGVTDAQHLVCNGDGCLARRPDQTWVGWGNNAWRRLGVGAPDTLSAPVPAAFGFALTDVSLGFASSCGVDGMGGARCWGGTPFGNGVNVRALPLITVVSLPN